MSTFENRTDVAHNADGGKALKEWFARAVPVRVTFKDEDELEAKGAGAFYQTEWDEIHSLPPDSEVLKREGYPFLAVLAHEAVHSTKAPSRLNRNNPKTFQGYLLAIADALVPMEETTADVAAVMLADEFGFDAGIMVERAKHNLEAAPNELKPQILADAQAAVAWLKAHATTVDKRQFDDDLARWAAE